MTAPVQYTIFPLDPHAHLYRVTLQVASPDPAGQEFYLPAWIPGSYMIREFARNVVEVFAHCAAGTVAIRKTDKMTWRCDRCAGPLTLVYDVYAWDLSVRAAHLDQTHGFFNGTSVFLAVAGQEESPCEVEINPPKGGAYRDWRVATALPRLDAPEYGFGLYQAASYDELADHPVEMGEFTLATFDACGVPHDVVLTGRHRADMERLCRDMKTICEHHIRFFGEPAPVDRYVFLVMVVGNGYGGLEHRASTALICSRDDLPLVHETEAKEAYRTFLGLVSHEYFHTWNVKRIKPAAYLPYDYRQENYTRQLWAFEGITSYYDDLALVRTGLLSVDQYFDTLGKTITRVLGGSGRLKQSVADSSFDAWIKFYRQDENAANSIVNYYTKGALVALALDLTLREGTGGRVSLDGVMRALWTRHGKPLAGVPEGGVEAMAEEVSGLDLKEFFADAVHGTRDLPLAELLARHGVLMADEQASPRKSSLGVTLAAGNDARIQSVAEHGAAHTAGLSAGDELIAVDGLKVTARALPALIESYPPDSRVAVHAFRRDELMRFDVRLKAAAPGPWKLRATDEDADAAARRKAWLMGGN